MRLRDPFAVCLCLLVPIAASCGSEAPDAATSQAAAARAAPLLQLRAARRAASRRSRRRSRLRIPVRRWRRLGDAEPAGAERCGVPAAGRQGWLRPAALRRGGCCRQRRRGCRELDRTCQRGGGQPGCAGRVRRSRPGRRCCDSGSRGLTVFIAGDSTVSTYPDSASDQDQAGWGQMLHEQVRAGVKIENRAIGGRTARRFIDDGKLDEIWQDIHAGDYLLIQFGTNDSNKSASYMHDGQTVRITSSPRPTSKPGSSATSTARAAGKPCRCWSHHPARNSAYCTGGNGTGAWAAAMRELGASEMLIVSDLNQRQRGLPESHLSRPEPARLLPTEGGRNGGRHALPGAGARKLAEFVADGLRAAGVPWVR